MRVQQFNQIGLISRNKLNTLENVSDLLTEHVPRAALDKLEGMMDHTFHNEETQKFQEYTNNQNFCIRSCPQLNDCLCSTMERPNRWRMMFADSWTRRLISRQPFLRRCVEIDILL